MTTQIQENQIQSERLAQRRSGSEQPALRAMLEARSVALVGASSRPGSFGERMVAEVSRSPAAPELYLVNPRYPQIGGRRCYPSLADLPGPVDLVLLGVPDLALEGQLALAASRGDRSAVIFGNAHETPTTALTSAETPLGTTTPPDPLVADAPPDAGSTSGLRQRLTLLAESAGMELCGAGCMGFANVGYGLRAMGYVEPDPLPAGPVALVTHSGSVFSALLRTRRAFGFTLAVSSGQELVTTAGSYLSYALEQPETKVLALVVEAIRQPTMLRGALHAAAERNIPVVMLTAGTSAAGKAMVAAHSGALAAADGGWEALTRAYGIHRVADLAELADTLELFALRTRPGRRANLDSRSSGVDGAGDPRGIATVHDSGLERAHAVDVASQLGVPFAVISDATRARLAALLDPGLVPDNPLDVWGTGAETRQLFAGSLVALAQDDAVQVVALAVDLVTELDGDDAYQLAALDAARRTDKTVAVLSNLPSAIDSSAAALLRCEGIPVLEGLRTGLLSLRHLLDHQAAASNQAAGRSQAAACVPATAASRPATTASVPEPATTFALAARGARRA